MKKLTNALVTGLDIKPKDGVAVGLITWCVSQRMHLRMFRKLDMGETGNKRDRIFGRTSSTHFWSVLFTD